MKNLLKEWLEFASNVEASDAAGAEILQSLRRRTAAALDLFRGEVQPKMKPEVIERENVKGGTTPPAPGQDNH